MSCAEEDYCVRYRWVDATVTEPGAFKWVSGVWDPQTINACAASVPAVLPPTTIPDRQAVGVFIRVQHKSLFPGWFSTEHDGLGPQCGGVRADASRELPVARPDTHIALHRISSMPRAHRLRMTFDELAASLTLIALAAIACLAPAQADTFWQLRAGQDFFRTGHVTLVDTYSHTVTGGPWPNHEWLWQVLAYGSFRIGGLPLLSLVNAAVATLAVVLSYRLTRGSPRRGPLLLLLSLPLIASSLAVRPQVTSMLLFVVLLWLVTRERLWWIPGLFLVWANLHAGVVVGGLVMIAATSYSALLWWRNPSVGNGLRLRTLSVVTVLSGLATLLTPLGIGLWTYLARSIPNARVSGVSEFDSAFRWGWSELAFWTWSLAVVALTSARWPRLTGWGDRLLVVVSLVMLPLALTAVRNVSWFVLASLPALIALTRPPPGTLIMRDNNHSRSHLAVSLACGGLATALVALTWSEPADRLGWRPMSQSVVSAVASCPGPLYNAYNEGGYLIWFTPQVPVFVDSRYDPYPLDFLHRHQETESTGDYSQTFATYGIRCAALPPASPTVASLIRDGWTPAASDPDWVVLNPPASGLAESDP